jgi:hypothetical protein
MKTDISGKHYRVLQDIFATPVRSNVQWKDIEKMLIAFGAEVTEGNGSRVRISFNNVKAVFHRPHPRKETDKGAVVAMKRFLLTAGISPEENDL